MPARESHFILPAEVLQESFSYLTRQELLNAIPVCRSFATSGRLFLYQSIDLRSDDPHVDCTISLLRSHRKITVRILHATLTTRPPVGARPWINPDFFVHSVNLKSLELRGFPYPLQNDQDIFNRTLRVGCPKLESFTYRPGVVTFPESGFGLAGLKCVSWQSELATIELRTTPMMTASIESLTHISFTGRIVHRTGKPYDDFLMLRFPNLLSLALGSLIHTNSEERTNIAITEFILAHPLIEHLSLGREKPTYMFFQLRPNLLQPDSLPCLKSFEGFPENVTVMASRKVRSLFKITSLSLRSCTQSTFEDVTAMFEAVKTADNTPMKFEFVKHLRFEFDVPLSHRMRSHVTPIGHRSLMDEFSEICPIVSTWYGRLLPMYAEEFKEMFEMYENLETISLPKPSLFIRMGTSPMEYFLPLSRRCCKLKRVIARKPPYTELEDCVFMLTRDARDELESVTIETAWDGSTFGIQNPT
ncbi:hypothetical protein BDZ97DRAFT_1918020 [Flammula alnicola]|nr:hypothetical protein BDZ97DRAFT_1918020 [Flammula alnicola]